MTRPFDAVVAEHGATILRVCRAHLPWHDAEDAWSETFLAALRAYDALPGDANVQAWLVTIAHRKCIDALRSRGKRAAPASDESAIWSEAAGGHAPVGTTLTARIDGVEDAANRIDLWAAIDALPTKQRHAVTYHHIAGLSHAEVAEIVGGSAEAARRASADGIGALRRAYAAGEETESRRTTPTMQPGGRS